MLLSIETRRWYSANTDKSDVDEKGRDCIAAWQYLRFTGNARADFVAIKTVRPHEAAPKMVIMQDVPYTDGMANGFVKEGEKRDTTLKLGVGTEPRLAAVCRRLPATPLSADPTRGREVAAGLAGKVRACFPVFVSTPGDNRSLDYDSIFSYT